MILSPIARTRGARARASRGGGRGRGAAATARRCARGTGSRTARCRRRSGRRRRCARSAARSSTTRCSGGSRARSAACPAARSCDSTCCRRLSDFDRLGCAAIYFWGGVQNGSFCRRARPGGVRRAIRGAHVVDDVHARCGTGGGVREAPNERVRPPDTAKLELIFAAQCRRRPLGSRRK